MQCRSHVVESFGVAAAAVYVPDKANIYRSGIDVPDLNVDQLKSIIARGEPMVDRARNLSYTPLKMGVRTVGAHRRGGQSFPPDPGGHGKPDRHRGRTRQRGGDADPFRSAREGERLRSAILDSVTHEFRTPLTAIKASITSLLSTPGLSPDDRQELMTVINEESDRLNRLVGEAAEVAQLESHEFQLDLQSAGYWTLAQAAVERRETDPGQASGGDQGAGAHPRAPGRRSHQGGSGPVAGECRQIFTAESPIRITAEIKRR